MKFVSALLAIATANNEVFVRDIQAAATQTVLMQQGHSGLNVNQYGWPIAPSGPVADLAIVFGKAPRFDFCKAGTGPKPGQFIASYDLAVQHEHELIPRMGA